MPEAISHASGDAALDAPVRVVVVTLDKHLSGVARRAEAGLRRDIPGLSIDFHAATDWADDRAALARCIDDIGRGDIVVASMLFMEDHVQSVHQALVARRDHCDAMIGLMSAGEIIRLTKLGPFRMDGSQKGPLALLKRLRGSKTKSGSSGAGQMTMLRRLPKLLRFIPGSAQDLRAYFLTMQYWLSGSQDNFASMIRGLVGRYADGPRRGLRGAVAAPAPREYPELGLYHPRAEPPIVETAEALPPMDRPAIGTVGLLILRSYVLATMRAITTG